MVDVLIVTVTEVESRAVLHAFGLAVGREAKPTPVGDRIYHDLGELNGTHFMMAITEMGTVGLGASQQAVQKGIAALKPAAVIMVGLAFGIDEKRQAIGDILVSQQLFLYSPKRVGANEIIPRGDKAHGSPSLINFLRSADLHIDKKSKPAVHFGLVLSGETLVDNIDYLNRLKELEKEAIGGEMEGAGLYVACQDAKVDWVLVKAICDWADGNKKRNRKKRQERAATNAAAFVVKAFQHAPFSKRKNAAGPIQTRFVVPFFLVAIIVLFALIGANKWQAPPRKSADEVAVEESPKARLAISADFIECLDEVGAAADGMGLELRSWDEIKSREERESMLTFSERFVLCIQQFISEPIPATGENRTWNKGIPIDIELQKGPHAKQLILRDVVVDVVGFHSVPPTFQTGVGLSRKPVIAIEMCNRKSKLPWRFHANWIADSNKSLFRDFHGELVEVNKPEWDAFTLKLLALDRGIYQFNISVILQQDDEPATTLLLTHRPFTVGFFARPLKEHPDYKFLHQRYIEKGGLVPRLLHKRPNVPGLGTCPN